jgi:hypothetical protein
MDSINMTIKLYNQNGHGYHCCGNEETRLGHYSLAKWRPRFRWKQTTKLFDVFLKRKRRSCIKKIKKRLFRRSQIVDD